MTIFKHKLKIVSFCLRFLTQLYKPLFKFVHFLNTDKISGGLHHWMLVEITSAKLHHLHNDRGPTDKLYCKVQICH